MMQSLRTRLIVFSGLLQVVTWAIVLYLAVTHMEAELREGYRIQLAQLAQTVGALSSPMASGQELPSETMKLIDLVPAGVSPDDFHEHLIQINAQGKTVYASRKAPPTPINTSPGFTIGIIEDAPWLLFHALASDTEPDVLVGILEAEVVETINTTLRGAIIPLVVTALMSTMLSFVLITLALRPLKEWACKLGNWSPLQTSPIEESKTLREVEPVRTAINRMLERVRASLDMERRFVRNAAHELRTPLAGINAQLEAGEWQGLNDEQQQRLAKVSLGVQRASRLTTQLLDLARVEDVSDDNTEKLELGQTVSKCLTDLLDSGRTIDHSQITFVAPTREVFINASRNDVETLIANLVDNALKHAGDRPEVRISIDAIDGYTEILVEDDGPGIPSEFLSEAPKRFVRHSSAGADGSGLGLAIVADIMTKIGGTMKLARSDDLGGLKVVLRMPVAPL